MERVELRPIAKRLLIPGSESGKVPKGPDPWPYQRESARRRERGREPRDTNATVEFRDFYDELQPSSRYIRRWKACQHLITRWMRHAQLRGIGLPLPRGTRRECAHMAGELRQKCVDAVSELAWRRIHFH